MPTRKRAYSYIRFSREHQSQGDSLRRQEEATRSYCERNGLVLDESLDLRDLGVSAYKGRNAEKGALGRFIAACEAGHIAPGSALVLESLDRLSRQSPRKTVSLLTQLLDDHGLEVHLTMVNKVFYPNKDDGVDLILAVAMAMRAHEESETKSKRLCEAWAKLREKAAREKIAMRSTLPWWLALKNGKIVAPPERARAVKRVFELTAKGYSSFYIARLFQSEGTPTWRPITKRWKAERVRDLVRSEAPCGVLVETYKTRMLGRTFRIDGYYPRIVSDELAAEARATLKRNDCVRRGRAPTPDRPINLFRALIRYRGGWMRFATHRNGPPDPITKMRGYNGYYERIDEEKGKSEWGIAASQLEPVVIAGLRELAPEDMLPLEPTETAPRTAVLRPKKAKLETKIANLVEAVESGSTSLARRLVELEGELVVLNQEIAKAEEEERKPLVNKEGFRNLSTELRDNASREATAAAIRRLVRRIDVGPTAKDLPLTDEVAGTLIKKMILDGADTFPDPVKATKRRKDLFILFTFASGARRLICRIAESNAGGVITVRTEPGAEDDGRRLRLTGPDSDFAKWKKKANVPVR